MITRSDADGQKSATLSARLREWAEKPVTTIARGLVNIGMTPNGLTVIGFLLACAAALLAAQGALTNAGVVYLLSGPFDALDGAVARLGRHASRFGAILDSTLDRYGEAIILSGLGFHLATEGNWIGLALAFAALIGSIMVSYVRARSEGLGIENTVGILTRFERMVVLVLSLLTTWVLPGLAIMTVLTHFTVAQRLRSIHTSVSVQ